MKSSAFIAASAGIILILGLVHLLYTFHGPNLHPRDPNLTVTMMNVSLMITRETTIWRVWLGLNASLSLGKNPQSIAADASYGNGEQLQWLMDRQITPYMPTRDTVARTRSPLFGPERLTYQPESNS